MVVEILKGKTGSIYRYPYKDAEVREKIAEYCNCDSRNIIIGNGSDEIIDLIFKAFKSPAVGMFPTFSEYRIVSQILNKDYNEIPLSVDFSFD